MCQEKNETVQVFSVQIREALNWLTIQFPGRLMPHEEDKTLCDQLFYGMKSELTNGFRHIYGNLDITFEELLNKARKVELEDNKGKEKKNDNQNNNGSHRDQNKGDARIQSKGPETRTKGPIGANCLKLVFSSSYAGCFLPCLLVLLFLRVGSLRLFWGMVVRGRARRDLC